MATQDQQFQALMNRLGVLERKVDVVSDNVNEILFILKQTDTEHELTSVQDKLHEIHHDVHTIHDLQKLVVK